jgi:hypothetical protein
MDTAKANLELAKSGAAENYAQTAAAKTNAASSAAAARLADAQTNKFLLGNVDEARKNMDAVSEPALKAFQARIRQQHSQNMAMLKGQIDSFGLADTTKMNQAQKDAYAAIAADAQKMAKLLGQRRNAAYEANQAAQRLPAYAHPQDKQGAIDKETENMLQTLMIGIGLDIGGNDMPVAGLPGATKAPAAAARNREIP